MTSAETIYLERKDGQVAKILLPMEDEDDVWCAVERTYPLAWEAADEGMLVPGYVRVTAWDVWFEPGEDEALAAWLAEDVDRTEQGREYE